MVGSEEHRRAVLCDLVVDSTESLVRSLPRDAELFADHAPSLTGVPLSPYSRPEDLVCLLSEVMGMGDVPRRGLVSLEFIEDLARSVEFLPELCKW